MLCLSIDNVHSSVFSKNNDTIIIETENINSDKTSSASEPSNTETDKQENNRRKQ